MKQRILTTAVVMAMFLATASPALAQSSRSRVRLQTRQTATVMAGGSAWLALNWLGSGEDATNFRVVVTSAPDGVEVDYPDYAPDFTGLMNGHVLSDAEMDFTAIRLTVPYNQTRSFIIRLEATYVQNGREQRDRVIVRVPVVRYNGRDLQLASDSVGSMPTDAAQWVGVNFAGQAPALDDFSMVVTHADATVTYPGYAASTSLHYNDTLESGETDVARFLVDTTGMQPGRYQLDVRATYSKGGTPRSMDGTVTLDVTG